MNLEELMLHMKKLIDSDMFTEATDSCGYGFLHALSLLLGQSSYVQINTGIEIQKYEDEEFLVTDTSTGETEMVD